MEGAFLDSFPFTLPVYIAKRTASFKMRPRTLVPSNTRPLPFAAHAAYSRLWAQEMVVTNPISAKEYQFCLIYKHPQLGKTECYEVKMVATKGLPLLAANGIMIHFSASGDDLPKVMFRLYKPLLQAC